MLMVTIQSKTSGIGFAKFQKGIDKSIKSAFKGIQPILTDDIKSTFDKQGKRGGNEEWIGTFYLQCRSNYPLHGTIQEKLAFNREAKTLIDTGKLRNSIKAVDFGATNNNWIMVIGSSVDYARMQHEGGVTRLKCGGISKARTIEIPARPFAYAEPKHKVLFKRLVKEGLQNVI